MTTIYVEGNIGIGKSTLLPKLGMDLGFEVIDENVDSNPMFKQLLKERYDNPTDGAYKMQMWLTQERRKAAVSLDPNKNYIIERSIISDMVFTNVDYLNDNMTFDQYDDHSKLAFDLLQSCVNPSLVVLLNADIQACMSRVLSRSRVEEKNIKLDYLDQLDSVHELLIPDLCKTLGFKLIQHDWTIPSKKSYSVLLSRITTALKMSAGEVMDVRHEF